MDPRLAGSSRDAALEGISNPAVRHPTLEQLEESRDHPALVARAIANVVAAALRDLGLLVLRRPEVVLGRRVPAEIDLVEALVVRQEDHLARQILLHAGRDRVVELMEQLVVALEPVLGDDDRAEVDLDLPARVVERGHRGDPFAHRAGSDVEQPANPLRHEAEADPRLALRVVVEQGRIDELRGKRSFGIRQGLEEVDEIAHVVGQRCIDRAVAVDADVVDPQVRVDLVRLGFRALLAGMPADRGQDLVDVHEEADGVGVALVARHVAVGARHGAAICSGGRQKVGAPAIRLDANALLDAKDEDGALDLVPSLDVALVAEQPRNAPVGVDLDSPGIRVSLEDLDASPVVQNGRFEVDRGDVEEACRGVVRRSWGGRKQARLKRLGHGHILPAARVSTRGRKASATPWRRVHRWRQGRAPTLA